MKKSGQRFSIALTSVLLIITLAGWGYYFLQQKMEFDTREAHVWKTYSLGRMSFNYPPESKLGSDGEGKPRIDLPYAEKIGTNLREKYVRIRTDLPFALCHGDEADYATSSEITFNGRVFTMRTDTETTDGKTFYYENYSTVHSIQGCIRLEFGMFSYNDLETPSYDYDGKPFRQFDLEKERALFQQIMSTFRFD
ncbi:MAG: hypothetical protein K0S38_993 [Candidatus Paceibacter sp.]|jgi:hypothetical protein|nr:hypothetical protein [Candidatus Paceibacter sp.]